MLRASLFSFVQPCETCPFVWQKAMFCKVKGRLLAAVTSLVVMRTLCKTRKEKWKSSVICQFAA